MKVLFIAPYRSNSGYGHAAKDYIKCMNSVGIDVVPRNILRPTIDPGEEIKSLEKKSSVGATTNIQFCLPMDWCYDGDFTNIGMVCLETLGVKYSQFDFCMSIMDEIWMTNESYLNSRPEHRKYLIDIPLDLKKYDVSYPKIDLKTDDFLFYTICEHTKRKNIFATVMAFWLAFVPEQQVNLVIKTNVEGQSPEQTKQELVNQLEEIKSKLKLYPTKYYKNPIIITDNYTDEQIYGLHSSCNCYISTSHGEAFNIPSYDAIGFENPSIQTELELKQRIPVFDMDKNYGEMYSGFESWGAPDILSISNQMIKVYEDSGYRKQLIQFQSHYLKNCSYESIGNRIKNRLLWLDEEKKIAKSN